MTKYFVAIKLLNNMQDKIYGSYQKIRKNIKQKFKLGAQEWGGVLFVGRTGGRVDGPQILRRLTG